MDQAIFYGKLKIEKGGLLYFTLPYLTLLLRYEGYLIFNSLASWQRYQPYESTLELELKKSNVEVQKV